jgi:ribosomal protein L37AE/L43A
MTTAPAVRALPYYGPQCPRCDATLPLEAIRSGTITCSYCTNTFEATAFDPPQRKLAVAETSQSGPEAANPCANHARNVAVTSCRRCGVFICALCDMNVGSGSFCPACFDRMRAEGSLPGGADRFRDYGALAGVAAFAGFFLAFLFLGVPFGILTLVYARKAWKQRRAEGRPVAGIVVAAVFGALELIAGIVMPLMLLLK